MVLHNRSEWCKPVGQNKGVMTRRSQKDDSTPIMLINGLQRPDFTIHGLSNHI